MSGGRGGWVGGAWILFGVYVFPFRDMESATSLPPHRAFRRPREIAVNGIDGRYRRKAGVCEQSWAF